MNLLAAVERDKAELVGWLAMRKRLADEHRHDCDVKNIETPSPKEQRELARFDELLSRLRGSRAA
jgi:hypothetical protein